MSRGISDLFVCTKTKTNGEMFLLKLSSRCVERRGKVGEAPVYLQRVHGHAIHASIFRNAPASRVVRVCNVSRSPVAHNLHFLVAAFPIHVLDP